MPHIIGREIEIGEDHNRIWIHEGDDVRQAKLEMWIAKKLGEHLVEQYPKRQWGVEVDIPGRMVIIMCPSVSLNKGYHLHMRGDTLDGLCKRAETAAGEIMERYGLSRNRAFNPDNLENLKRLFNDEAVSADSDGVDPIIRRDR